MYEYSRKFLEIAVGTLFRKGSKIKEMQYLGGGMVTFLEAENEEKLLSFYCNNRLSQFDTRHTISDADESHELVQLLRLL